jgi:hypothetical protein
MKSIIKIIGQILIILFFAGLVIGAVYLAVQNNVISLPTRGEGRDFGERFESQPPAASNGEFRPQFGDDDGFRGEFERGEHGQVSILRGMGGVMGNLVKITIITVIILFIQNLVSRKPTPKTVTAP